MPATADHPYLVRKGVKAFPGVMLGAWPQRQKEGCLLIPLRTADGLLASVQAIFPSKPADGRDKDFLKGGSTQGAHFVIGDLLASDTVIIAEGYATAATLHEATGHAAVMALDAGNLRPVAEILKKLHPAKKFIIAADNDRGTEGNPGITKATAAAKAIKAALAIPSFDSPLEDDDATGTDFNDLAALRGLDAVRAALQGAAVKAVKAEKQTAQPRENPYRGTDPQPTAVGPDGLLVNPRTGRSLIKHNAAAERLYNLDFAQRLLFDPVELEWREYQPAKGIFKTRSALAIEQAVYRAVNRHCGGLGFDTAYILSLIHISEPTRPY